MYKYAFYLRNLIFDFFSLHKIRLIVSMRS